MSAARLAGTLYLSLLPFGIFSFAYVPAVLFVRGDAAATARKIVASEWLFRSATVSHVISQVIVVFLALTMYRLFSAVNKQLAATMCALAMVCVPISVLNETYNLAVIRVLNGAEMCGFSPAQRQDQALLLLDTARNGVLLAQVFWGLWLLPLAALIFRSGFLPQWLGAPVLIAAAGYLFDSFTQVLKPGTPTISPFTALAEIVLPSWLVIKAPPAR